MRKLYESRHIQKYLGINKDQLYHWIQTRRIIRPAIEGVGRGGRSKFSFKDLLYLALTRELIEFGFELRTIKTFFNNLRLYYPAFDPNSKDLNKARKKSKSYNIFDYVEKLKEANKDNKNMVFYYVVLKDKDLLMPVVYHQKGQPKTSKDIKCILQINLSIIIKELEEKTGEKF
ncbi:MAG: MerR family transcriptional regulator [Candidatus Aminicenantes bacterium]|nr:MerR family transcriptional regulator [Candidatus Aminicenantes bacterium]